jgi:hypothetical protein
MLKNAIFWVVMPRGSFVVLSRATWHNKPEDGILHSHRHESLKFHYMLLVGPHS